MLFCVDAEDKEISRYKNKRQPSHLIRSHHTEQPNRKHCERV